MSSVAPCIRIVGRALTTAADRPPETHGGWAARSAIVHNAGRRRGGPLARRYRPWKTIILHSVTVFGIALAWAAAAYAVISLYAVLRARRRVPLPPVHDAPVSILKPLHGGFPDLERCLASFFELDGPEYELIFGVSSASDPALAVVAALRERHPTRPVAVVIDARSHGTNPKVSNLINMFPAARHDRLVIVDADIEVERDYLRQVVAPLSDPTVGLVTCLYRGAPAAGTWSRLGALYIDDWFAPAVCVAHLFGAQTFGFGATLALRRDALLEAGGFEALADQLADDWWLGELTRRRGLATRLANCVVATTVDERSLWALCAHELRWLLTVRCINPLGYAFSFVTFGLPMATLGAGLAQGQPAALTALCVALTARIALRLVQHRRGGSGLLWALLLIPVRDGMNVALWAAALFARRARWAGHALEVAVDGRIATVTDEHETRPGGRLPEQGPRL